MITHATHPPAPQGTAVPPPPAPDKTVRGDRPPAGGRRPIGWGLALIAAGTLWLLSEAGVAIRWELVLAVGLVAVGLLVLAGGRWSGGLVGLGVVLTVLAVAVAMTPTTTSISAGDRIYTVTHLADLEDAYTLGAGTMTIDLRQLPLPEGTTPLTAAVTAGELVVRVPEGVTLTGTAEAVLGEVTGLDGSTGGVLPSRTIDEPGDETDRVLLLDLQVGVGRIEVQR